MGLKQNRPDRSYRDTLLNATPAKTTKRLLQLVLPNGGVLSHARSGAPILADTGADSGREGKSKRAETRPDQFQTVTAVLAADWCQKTFVFFCLIRSQNGGDRVELVW